MYLRNRLSANQTGELLVALISRVSPPPITTAETEEYSIKLLLILIKDKNVCWMYEYSSIYASVHTSYIFIYIHTYIYTFIQVANIVVNIVAIGYIKQICMDRCTHI